MTLIQLAAGLALLLAGGEALVRGSVAVARRLGVSPLVIGLTLVGFGTSTPELVASLEAALQGAPAIAVGNIVGSNIANILLILGVAAVILPIGVGHDGFARDAWSLGGVTVLFTALALRGAFGRLTGLLLVALLAAYTVLTYLSERRAYRASARIHEASVRQVEPTGMGTATGLALTVGGIAGVVIGANLLIGAALVIARQAAIPEAVIGVTLVAVGTSLPELITSVMAAVRGQSDVAYGNIVGSNIFNALGIMGVTAAVQPTPVAPEILRYDIWVMVLATLLLVVFGATARRLERWEGAVLLAGYALYVTVLLVPGLRALLPG